MRVAPEAAEALQRLAAATYPVEGCGVLLGVLDGEGGSVVEAIPGRNLVTDRARDRYELDPLDIVAADRRARDRGLDVVGFWHTHPDHPARPSRFDAERAWPEYVYAICSTTVDGVADLRWWRLGEGGEFTQLDVEAQP